MIGVRKAQRLRSPHLCSLARNDSDRFDPHTYEMSITPLALAAGSIRVETDDTKVRKISEASLRQALTLPTVVTLFLSPSLSARARVSLSYYIYLILALLSRLQIS